MVSFALLVIPMTIEIYLKQVRSLSPAGLTALSAIEELAIISMFATLPLFAHSLSPFPWVKKANAVCLWGCAALGLPILVLVFTPLVAMAQNVSFALLSLSITYSVVVGLCSHRSPEWAGRDVYGLAKWRRITLKIMITTALIMPLFIMVDFFPYRPLTSRLPKDFYVYPAFYALWNLYYLVESLRSAKAAVEPLTQKAPLPLELRRFGISEREAEVVGLLLSGLAYREIADRLCVSLATVKTHVNRVYQKCGVGNKIELLRLLSAPSDPK
jgi:DNA-binding CsgD family transcriptional regulator